MVKIQITDINTVLGVFEDKVLFDASLPDPDRELRDAGLWHPDPTGSWEFLEVVDGESVLGIIRYQPISIVAIDCHIHILSKYWRSKISDSIIPAFEEFIRNNTKYHKLQVQCPKCCDHTIKVAARHGFEIEGVLVGASYWNKKIEDLVIMGKFIRRIN